MTSDRELLELAAKAAAMELGRYSDGWHYSNDGIRGAGVYKIDPGQNPAGNPRYKFLFWNTLADDGCAHRLAVKLGINILHSLQNGDVVAGRSGITGFRVAYGDDANAATRRAITEAAAEIGRGMD